MKNTNTQQENLRRQTFGVEVECYGITRENAAKTAAAFFRKPNAYEYAGEGYMKWVAYDKQERRWEFAYDSSIEANCPEEKCEMVTPILTYSDLPMLSELLTALKNAGAQSDSAHKCGIHIHIGIGGERPHTPKTIRNLVNLMASHEKQIGRVISLDPYREGYCEAISRKFLDAVNKNKYTDWTSLAKAWYRENGCGPSDWKQHYSDSRYHALNLHPCMSWKLGGEATYGTNHAKPTIEFRLFQFSEERGIQPDELTAFIQLCLAMSERAKAVKTASPKPQQKDNEKYAFRCWLLQLGFIGDEFKTSRNVLLRNVPGNSAWRTEEQARAH